MKKHFKAFAGFRIKEGLALFVLGLLFFSACSKPSIESADALYEKKQYAEAFKIYQSLSGKNPQAQYQLGRMYQIGEGIEQNIEESFKWYEKAAEQGHVEAQYQLGSMYQGREGIKQDFQEAFKWYKKAAEQGHVKAQLWLGHLYGFGSGIKQDSQEAFKWHKKAAEQGDADAQTLIALEYYLGRTAVNQNSKEAFFWFKKAAEQGKIGLHLALMYFSGDGVKRDHQEAIKWLKKAVNQGDDRAEIILKSIEGALRGDPEDQYNLGLIYFSGYYSGRENYQEGVIWLQKAARQGHRNALDYLSAIARAIEEHPSLLEQIALLGRISLTNKDS